MVKLHPPQFRRGSREPPRTISKKASMWSRGNPKFRAGVGRMDVQEAPRVARCFGNRTERVGGGDITADCQRCFGNARVLSASIHSEQHVAHVKVRLFRQWRPVLSRYGMRGVHVGEASNPGPMTTHSASRILATQVGNSGIEDERNPGARPRRGHRRGLVVEIAPNVVDATAVDLSSSPHDGVVDALEFDLPVDDKFCLMQVRAHSNSRALVSLCAFVETARIPRVHPPKKASVEEGWRTPPPSPQLPFLRATWKHQPQHQPEARSPRPELQRTPLQPLNGRQDYQQTEATSAATPPGTRWV